MKERKEVSLNDIFIFLVYAAAIGFMFFTIYVNMTGISDRAYNLLA